LEIDQDVAEVTGGDYDHLLQATMRYVDWVWLRPQVQLLIRQLMNRDWDGRYSRRWKAFRRRLSSRLRTSTQSPYQINTVEVAPT
jgi:hypothetical protein